jgi:hypothetical protein
MKPANLNSTNLLTDVERRWYKCFAADILSRRFLWDQLGSAFQLILAGSCGILGILWLGWSSEQKFAFIILGLWVVIFRNFVKITCMFQGMQNLVKNFEETGGVSNIWYIVDRIKHPEIEDPADARQNLIGIQQSQGKLVSQVRCGTGIDLLMGGVSTGILVVLAMSGDFRFDFATITNGGFLWAVAAFLAYETWLTVIQVYDFRRHREERLVMMYPGFSGAGLFLLVFIVILTKDRSPENPTNWTMFVIYAVVTGWGVSKILWAIMTWRKTIWLTRRITRN